jgi:hypothetical protein
MRSTKLVTDKVNRYFPSIIKFKNKREKLFFSNHEKLRKSQHEILQEGKNPLYGYIPWFPFI